MREKNIRLIFVVSIFLKGVNALLEIIVGFIFLFTGAATAITWFFIQGELIEDPGDLVANSILHYLPYFSGHAQFFVSWYLLSHGIIKLFLAVALLRNKLWAYPAAIVVFALFIIYQLYRFTYTHSIFLIIFTVVDLAVIWLTWHEYRIMKKNKLY